MQNLNFNIQMQLTVCETKCIKKKIEWVWVLQQGPGDEIVSEMA
jgi:hypothetical protein